MTIPGIRDASVKSWSRPFVSNRPFYSCPLVHGLASRGDFVVSWCAGSGAQRSAQRSAVPAGSVGRRDPGRRSGQGRGSGLPLHAQHAICLLTALCCLLRAVRRQEHLLQLRPRDPGSVSAQGETPGGRVLRMCWWDVSCSPEGCRETMPAPGPLNFESWLSCSLVARLWASISISLRPRGPV